MSVRILKRAYTNAFAPPTEPKPDWLIGNTGDWLRLNMEVEAGVDFLATQSQPVSISKEERTIKLMNGKKWSEYGFDIGANIVFTFKTNNEGTVTVYIINLDIEQLFADTLVYAVNPDMDDVPFEIIPTDRGNIKVTSVKFYDDREIEGVKMKYANVDNSQVESHSLTSFIDGTETEMVYNQLLPLTEAMGFQDMTLIGNQSGMSINRARIRKIETTGDIYEQLHSTGNQSITLTTNTAWPNFVKKRDAWALPLAITNNQPSYQNVAGWKVPVISAGPGLGDYFFGFPQMCFIYNNGVHNTKKFKLNFKFTINYTNKNDTNCYLALVLIKYVSGADLIPYTRQELKKWNINSACSGGQVL